MIQQTEYWHRIDSSHVQCDLCPRYCRLKEGQRGFCYIRKNRDQQVVLTSYGRSSGFAVDPIEKKPLNHFLPGSRIFSFGTAGCNLGCKFCQNWDMSKSRQMDTLMAKANPEQIAIAAQQNHCLSVAYTYNDPVIFLEYAYDTAQACIEKGIKSVAVTAAYICEKPREKFFSVMHAANIDLKFFDETSYFKLTGSHLQNVLETIEYVHQETPVWLELTTLLIPGVNDSDKELGKLTDWVSKHLGADVPLHFSAFHPDYKMMNYQRTSLNTLLRARDIAHKNGIHHVYTGNIMNTDSSSTYCHHCNSLLIKRNGYQTELVSIDKQGLCKNCRTFCQGIYN